MAREGQKRDSSEGICRTDPYELLALEVIHNGRQRSRHGALTKKGESGSTADVQNASQHIPCPKQPRKWR